MRFPSEEDVRLVLEYLDGGSYQDVMFEELGFNKADYAQLRAENERLRDLVKRWSCQYDMTDIIEPHQYELLRESEQALTNGGYDA